MVAVDSALLKLRAAWALAEATPALCNAMLRRLGKLSSPAGDSCGTPDMISAAESPGSEAGGSASGGSGQHSDPACNAACNKTITGTEQTRNRNVAGHRRALFLGLFSERFLISKDSKGDLLHVTSGSHSCLSVSQRNRAYCHDCHVQGITSDARALPPPPVSCRENNKKQANKKVPVVLSGKQAHFVQRSNSISDASTNNQAAIELLEGEVALQPVPEDTVQELEEIRTDLLSEEYGCTPVEAANVLQKLQACRIEIMQQTSSHLVVPYITTYNVTAREQHKTERIQSTQKLVGVAMELARDGQFVMCLQELQRQSGAKFILQVLQYLRPEAGYKLSMEGQDAESCKVMQSQQKVAILYPSAQVLGEPVPRTDLLASMHRLDQHAQLYKRTPCALVTEGKLPLIGARRQLIINVHLMATGRKMEKLRSLMGMVNVMKTLMQTNKCQDGILVGDFNLDIEKEPYKNVLKKAGIIGIQQTGQRLKTNRSEKNPQVLDHCLVITDKEGLEFFEGVYATVRASKGFQKAEGRNRPEMDHSRVNFVWEGLEEDIPDLLSIPSPDSGPAGTSTPATPALAQLSLLQVPA